MRPPAATTGFWVAAVLAGPPLALAAASIGYPLPVRSPAADLAVLALWSLCEEVVFRGALQPWLALRWRRWPGPAAARARFGITPANAATSAVFVVAHLWRLGPAAAALWPVSLLFGLARERSGRIWPPALLHLHYNACLYAASAWLAPR